MKEGFVKIRLDTAQQRAQWRKERLEKEAKGESDSIENQLMNLNVDIIWSDHKDITGELQNG